MCAVRPPKTATAERPQMISDVFAGKYTRTIASNRVKNDSLNLGEILRGASPPAWTKVH